MNVDKYFHFSGAIFNLRTPPAGTHSFKMHAKEVEARVTTSIRGMMWAYDVFLCRCNAEWLVTYIFYVNGMVNSSSLSHYYIDVQMPSSKFTFKNYNLTNHKNKIFKEINYWILKILVMLSDLTERWLGSWWCSVRVTELYDCTKCTSNSSIQLFLFSAEM